MGASQGRYFRCLFFQRLVPSLSLEGRMIAVLRRSFNYISIRPILGTQLPPCLGLLSMQQAAGELRCASYLSHSPVSLTAALVLGLMNCLSCRSGALI